MPRPIHARPRTRRLRPLDWLAAGGVLLLLGLAAREVERRVGLPSEVGGFGEAVDGDSLLLSGWKVRLKGLDAPELAQWCVNRAGRDYACGVEAKTWLRQRLSRGAVSCRVEGRDRYDRLLAVCHVGSESLNAGLVRAGLAVAYGAFEVEEGEARNARRGLWAGQFEAPSAWRAANPSR
jgi:endonuclease YncB( thermonuclease family)